MHLPSQSDILFRHMATNVEVEKNNNESRANVIRRFTKRVQGAGIVPKIRGGRYSIRLKSKNVQRTSRLKKIVKRDAYEKLVKLGKVPEFRGRRR